jgi:hypothetical protein
VDQDLVQLSVIFVLLRAAPDLVVIGAASWNAEWKLTSEMI